MADYPREPRDAYTGRAWSGMDIVDLRRLFQQRRPIEVIARLLCRSRDEVSEKIARLEAAGKLRNGPPAPSRHKRQASPDIASDDRAIAA
jgi:hypothetical protein